MINRVILVGHLTADAEAVKTTGKPMSRMRLATDQQWKDADENRQETVEFHTVISFGRLAEICTLYCSRGRRVEGRLRTRDYEGTDGVRRYATEIVADTVKLLQSRADGADAAPDPIAVGVDEGA